MVNKRGESCPAFAFGELRNSKTEHLQLNKLNKLDGDFTLVEKTATSATAGLLMIKNNYKNM
jgi:hypothetical protein